MTAVASLVSTVEDALANACAAAVPHMSYVPDGLASPGTVPVYTGFTPEAPDRAITITVYDWPELAVADGTAELGFQVRARAAARAAAWDDQEQIKTVLEGRLPKPIDRAYRRNAQYIGRDDQGRPEVTANYILYIHTI